MYCQLISLLRACVQPSLGHCLVGRLYNYSPQWQLEGWAMVDWAHEQLSMLQGQLTFLKLGSARIFYRHICSDENDVTDVYVELMERCIEQWTDLMVQHNIPVHSLMLHERRHFKRAA